MRIALRRLSGPVPRALSPLLGLAALLCLAPAAQAQWKWVAPSGVVQYSDQPPPSGTPARSILARPTPSSMEQPAAPASGASAAARVRAGLAKAKEQQEQQRKAQEQARQLQAQVQAQQRAQVCEQARQQLQLLDSGRRVRQAGPNGELNYLDSAQIQAQRAQAQAAMQAACY
ncbi:MAG: DUF4124 domain-containing protein [Betaproteobacteria bacterium]|nr:DUF4124 domain-containing protein [Betaproteobacteria bacterium]MBU6513060.1 DUF4124 domain-containing protein [Betaproteobacteria bacterium]MDE1956599.1 DUF4124 domain-containing protein [Betaproteobacteria bacterium]MDE2154012.1 DUF4124 domain-containing protein [Betaproteobacteria bacterium]MDE2477858.1 DUF4124 domain-containing protein [Betaproteobacteria bacterium]